MSLASASSKALCVTLASSRSLKLLPILGVPSLPLLGAPSFPPAPLCWRGESPNSAARRGESAPCGGRGGCVVVGRAWVAELVLLDEECSVVGLTDRVGVAVAGRGSWGRRRVAVGSMALLCIGSEKGRKAGESSESSSVEESGPRDGLAEEKRGRRVKARLLVTGTGSSDELEDDEELGLSLRAV